MTLRDLTKRQLYNLRRRCEKERKAWCHERGVKQLPLEQATWRLIWGRGLKAGLGLK